MLYIEQASAGSGKTFMLAKTFIRNLMGERLKGEERYRLRSPEEMAYVLGRILAVTFTNKATNEMKMRIVQKLAGLADWSPGTAGKKPDYLDDFVKEFKVAEERIIQQARTALKVLLHGYADFRVSTIDSFFQTVMRSFTAEIEELNDSYQLELDDAMVAGRSVDATMSQLRENDDTRAHTSDLRNWVQMLVKRNMLQGISWNPFSLPSVYGQLKKFTALTNSENFKRHEDELTEYFRGLEVPFRQVFTTIVEAADEDRTNAHNLFKEAYRRLQQMQGFELLPSVTIKGVPGFLKLCSECLNTPFPPNFKFGANVEGIVTGDKSPFTKKGSGMIGNPQVEEALSEGISQLIIAAKDWEKIATDWKISTEYLPMLGLLSVVLENRRQFLNENNILPISSTNRILQDIIREDGTDTPFIYERTGEYIDHYLIDEFQDTSVMQWNNLRPLLLESISRECDNLIIGDVKQSIYRFRNAEPKLISETVPSDRALQVNLEDRKQSTNWRSSRHIVQFNNTLFSLIASYMPESLRKEVDLRRLYGNVVQKIHNADLPGYVSLQLATESKRGETPQGLAETPELIHSLMARGYAQKEIAVLVDTRTQANRVIECITNFNASLSPEQTPINVISDDSLLISSSQAVQGIISVLEAMKRPTEQIRRHWDCKGLACTYHSMRRKDPNVPFDTIVAAHVEKADKQQDVEQMLKNLKSLSLPSLVEAIAGNYLSEEQRTRETAYIAALQDLVLDYCETQPTDSASFLKWWHEFGCHKCISSSESTEAVRVMTIHKSKGLEFGCVIIPMADWSFLPSFSLEKRDTLWAPPRLPREVDMRGLPLPPVIAVGCVPELEDSPYKQEFVQYCRDTMIDILNKTYVAFTRAKRELYIYVPYSKGEGSLCQLLQTVLPHLPNSQFPTPDLHIQLPEWKAEGSCYTYGEIPPISQSPSRNRASGFCPRSPQLPTYHIYPERDLLKSVPEGEDSQDTGDNKEETELGTALHLAMSRVSRVEDLPAAMLSIAVEGRITRREADRWTRHIAAQLSTPRIARWFAPHLRVLNERNVWVSDSKRLRRPDRIVVDESGNATVIDYKFGEVESPAYHTQLQEYVSALRDTGCFRSVTGYLWYVSTGKIVN